MEKQPTAPIPAENAGTPAPGSDQEAQRLTTKDSAEADGVEEVGGPAGPDPTRFGDWERKGRCIDF